MYKIQILKGHSLINKEISFEEFEEYIRETFKDAKQIKICYNAPVKKGFGMHTSSKIEVNSIEFSIFNDNFIMDINNQQHSLSMDKSCNITILRPEPFAESKILFEDFSIIMYLMK